MISAIENRRSIRKYKDTPVSRRMVEEVIRAGILAPSAMNAQPWRFVVATGESKEDVMKVMEQGLEREKIEPLLPDHTNHITGVGRTMSVMRQAPVVIFIVNEQAPDFSRELTNQERIMEIFHTQSIGAAIENMALTAADMGLGTLWIGHTFFAQKELCQWLGVKGQHIAALTLGYPDESPAPRPRKGLDEVTEWRD